jgi:glutathione synthase/RimK-type ligase-like ATP-grasp enzyme
VILIVTNRRDYTADYVILEMQRCRVSYFRLNTEDVPQTVGVTRRIGFDDIRSVWFRRPVAPVPSWDLKEATVREFCVTETLVCLESLWRSLDAFWISRPDSIRAAESKPLQLAVASRLGFSIPLTVVTSDPREACQMFDRVGQIVYKPLRRARLRYGDRSAVVFTSVVSAEHAAQFDKVQYAPCLLQEYVPKVADIRVTIFGQEVFATEIQCHSEIGRHGDWRRCPPQDLSFRPHNLPATVESRCVALVEAFNLRFGAIDLILAPDGRYIFLEINPNGQWAWIQQCTGTPMTRSLIDLLVRESV